MCVFVQVCHFVCNDCLLSRFCSRTPSHGEVSTDNTFLLEMSTHLPPFPIMQRVWATLFAHRICEYNSADDFLVKAVSTDSDLRGSIHTYVSSDWCQEFTIMGKKLLVNAVYTLDRHSCCCSSPFSNTGPVEVHSN